MDLKAILAANKSKATQSSPMRKPITIADQDRPYAISENEAQQIDLPSSVIKTEIKTDIQSCIVQSEIQAQKDETEILTSKTAHELVANREQAENKPNTNSTQSEYKVDTNLTQKPNTNLTQSEHKVSVKNTNSTQTQHKVHTKLNTRKTQTQHKVDTNLTQTAHISTLVGIQRLILLFIFDECKKARSHVSDPLSVTHISNSLEIASGSVKTSIFRLCEKAFLIVNSFKNGRGGWSTYEIPNNIYNELLQMETRHKLNTKHTQTKHKVHTKLNTQPNTTLASSSSFKDLKTTTTSDLPDEWNFDITSYARFGFTMSQIKQLVSLDVISATDVEQSLIEFNYDLNNNSLPPIKTSKINFLMGLLRAGNSYVSEGFKNEQEETALEMANRAKEKRDRLMRAKFEAWEAGLNDEERNDIEKNLPTHLMVLHRAHGISNVEVRKWLFEYYLKKVI